MHYNLSTSSWGLQALGLAEEQVGGLDLGTTGGLESVMVRRRIAMIATLGVALLSGCVERAPSSSIPDQVALASRLSGLEARLTAVEQALAAQAAGQRRGVALEKNLAELRREIVAQQATLEQVRREVEALPARRASAVSYRAVDLTLGELPGGAGAAVARPVPAEIPETAQEILVYAQVATGYVKGGPHRFRIATRLDSGEEAAFYLYAIGRPQQGWAYNSTNMWLPMSKKRELLLQTEGEPFFGDWNSELRIIGYR